MHFTFLGPFVPSGPDYEGARQFFVALGFSITWEDVDYTGFQNGNCKFILQRFDNRAFAENFMISVGIPDAEAFWTSVIEKGLPVKFGIRMNPPQQQPYGKEVNIIDGAGVCWHFVEQNA
jgi:hypothetical protein